MSKPVSPDEIDSIKLRHIPDEVWDAFNELIRQNWNGKSATFRQEDVEKRIKQLLPPERHADIYANRWLDVEGAYRTEGWKVDYDKPGYNESYPSTFTFTRP